MPDTSGKNADFTAMLIAGNAFRDGIISKADAHVDGAPLWHGWAIMLAFKAGFDLGRNYKGDGAK